MKNPRHAWNLKDPFDEINRAYPMNVGGIISLVGLIVLGAFTYFLIPSPINWPFISIEAGIVIMVTVLASQKLYLDWFNQHYEIREKQREAEK